MSTPRDESGPPFVIVDGDPDSQVVIHVPHASTAIPDWVRDRIVLSDDELAHELVLMTDARTDEIAQEARIACDRPPWLFVNQRSRLVVDPERFPDSADEVMAAPAIGMGAVYMQTADGHPLRGYDPTHQDELLTSFFQPYADAFARLIERRLDRVGAVTIVDLHSYPLTELAYERHVHADAPRPACCIGTDAAHTPPALVHDVAAAFADLGETLTNEPFTGTYVPLQHYGKDLRVRSVMVELRRDTYLDSPQGLKRVAGMLAALVNAVDGTIKLPD